MNKTALVVAVLACLVLPAFSYTCFCDCQDGRSAISTGTDKNSATADCMLRRLLVCPGSTFKEINCTVLTPQQIIWCVIGGIAALICLIVLCCCCCCNRGTKVIYQVPSSANSSVAYVQYGNHHGGHHHGHH